MIADLDYLMEKEREVIYVDFLIKRGAQADSLERAFQDSLLLGRCRTLKLLSQCSAKLRKARKREQEVQLDRG